MTTMLEMLFVAHFGLPLSVSRDVLDDICLQWVIVNDDIEPLPVGHRINANQDPFVLKFPPEISHIQVVFGSIIV